MPTLLHVLLSPAEWQDPARAPGPGTVAVVFDVLRATSTAVTALAHGAAALIPVASLEEAVAWRQRRPDCLLAGERGGMRPSPDLTGGIAFDLGNSPREFLPDRVRGRLIVFTTTNGSRALRACQAADAIVAGAFLNLGPTLETLRTLEPPRVTLVCAGTGPDPALEDLLAAGALVDRWRTVDPEVQVTDAAAFVWHAWRSAAPDLIRALADSTNAQRLLAHPDLRDDVAWCLQQDRFNLAVWLAGPDGGLQAGDPAAAAKALRSRQAGLPPAASLC